MNYSLPIVFFINIKQTLIFNFNHSITNTYTKIKYLDHMENILLTLLSKMIKQRFISPLFLAELSAAPGARGSTKRLQARAVGAPGQMVQLLLQGILLTGIQGENSFLF